LNTATLPSAATSGANSGKNSPASSDGAFVREFHPSIASTSVGAWLGCLYESLPRLTPRLRWSHLLFCLPTAPLGAGLWLWLKGTGERYVLTTATVERRRNIGDRVLERVELAAVEEVRVETGVGDGFYGAGTLVMVGAGNVSLMTWHGVAEPQGVRRTILDAVEGARQLERMRRTIAGRST
jgi:hypothetical protein